MIPSFQNPSESSASRIVQRKVAELLSGDVSRDMGKARSMALDLVDQVVFVGVLKSFNETAGCGFIECKETKILFSRHLPVQKAQCEGVPIGELVSFRIQMVRGQPCVYNVVC